MIQSWAGQLEMARRRLDAGRAEEVVPLLESLANQGAPAPSVAPLLYRAYLMRARTRLAAERFDESLADVQQALKLRPDQREGYDLLLQVQAARAALPELADTLQRQLATDPKNADLRLILAKAYEKLGWYPEARSAAMLARDQKPTLAEAHHLLRRVEKLLEGGPAQYREAADRRVAAGDVNGAMGALFKWAEATSSAANYLYVAEWCEKADRRVAAVNAYKHALTLDPTLPQAQVGLWRLEDKLKPLTEAQLKQLYDGFMRAGDANGAADFLAQYTTRHPRAALALLLLTKVMPPGIPPEHILRRQWEEGFRANRRYWEAVEYYKGLTERDRNEYAPFIYLGYAYAAVGELEKAYEAQKHAAMLRHTAESFNKLGDFCLSEGLTERAEEAYRWALKVERGNSTALSKLGSIRQRGDDLDKLKEREGLPRFAYLEALSRYLAGQGQHEELAKYYSVLGDVMRDDPGVFRLLGAAHDARAIMRSAAAYLHQAALDGTAHQYVWAGDFCFGKQFDEWAREAYRAALLLNPFHRHARFRLSMLGDHEAVARAQPLESRTREDQARDLCETLRGLSQAEAGRGDTTKLRERLRADAAKLLDSLIGQRAEQGVIKDAEAAYRQLQRLYPTHAFLGRDLAQVYLRAGRAAQAWHEAIRTLRQDRLERDVKEELEAIAGRAETELKRRGEVPPDVPVHVLPGLDDAYFITTDWSSYELSRGELTPSNGAVSDWVRQAQAEVDAAQDASVEDGNRLRHWLAAATLYQKANRASEMVSCLVQYGEGRAQVYQQSQAAKAPEWFRQTVELAVSHAVEPLDRQAALAAYSLSYLQRLEARYRLPSTWPPDVVAAWRGVVQVVSSLAPPLTRWLHLLDQVLAALRSPEPAAPFQGPWHRAAVLQWETRVVLPPSIQGQVNDGVVRWLADIPLPATITPSRTQLRLEMPDRPDSHVLAANAAQADVTLTIRNEGKVPADAVRVTLCEASTQAAQTPVSDDFIAFIPSGGQATVTFHLALPPPLVEYMELEGSLTYFDPVERQKGEVTAVLTLRRAGQRPPVIPDPYAQPERSGQPFKPQYGDRESLWLALTAQARESGITWKREAAYAAIELAGREKGALWGLASEVVKRLQRVERTVVLGLDVAAAAEAMTQDQDCPPFQALLRDSGLDASMGLVLACLASSHDNRWLLQDTLLQRLQEWGCLMERMDLVRRIFETEHEMPLLDMDGASRATQYRFRSELLRRWLNRHWTPLQASHHLHQTWLEARSGLLQRLSTHVRRAINLHRLVLQMRDEGLQNTQRLVDLLGQRDQEIDQALTIVWHLLEEKEREQARQLCEAIRTSQQDMDETIRKTLKKLARERGWSELEIKMRLGLEPGGLEEQMAKFILNVWEIYRPLPPVDPITLYEALITQFNLEEIKDLCLQLEVNYETLAGDTLQRKAQALIDYFSRRGRMAELGAQIVALRPTVQF